MNDTSNSDNFPSYEELYRWLLENDSCELSNLESNEQRAGRRANALLNLVSPIRERFLHWYRTGEVQDDLQVSEFKLSDYLKKGYSIPIAFVEFNGLYKDPKNYFSVRLLW